MLLWLLFTISCFLCHSYGSSVQSRKANLTSAELMLLQNGKETSNFNLSNSTSQRFGLRLMTKCPVCDYSKENFHEIANFPIIKNDDTTGSRNFHILLPSESDAQFSIADKDRKAAFETNQRSFDISSRLFSRHGRKLSPVSSKESKNYFEGKDRVIPLRRNSEITTSISGKKPKNQHSTTFSHPTSDPEFSILKISKATESREKNSVNIPRNDTPQNSRILSEALPKGETTIDYERQDQLPCFCQWSSQKCGCECAGSLTREDFEALSLLFQPCHHFEFSITGGEHHSLPPCLFSRIRNPESIKLKIANATFEYLFDPIPHASAFAEVSFNRTALVKISGVNVRRGWNWTPLEQLRSQGGKGVDLELTGCGLRRLSSDFARVAEGNVRTVSISNSRLEMVGGGAFSTFNGLTRFRVPHNRLRTLRRTDLPKEPRDLQEIDLRDNNLQSLDEDLFDAMPSLEVISLTGNPLKMLSEGTFSRVIGKAYLQGVSDFSLNCDCTLRWLKNSTMQQNALVLRNLKGATCKRPPHLRGTPFMDLAKEHLRC